MKILPQDFNYYGHRRITLIVIFVLFLFLLSSHVEATSVREVSMDEMLNTSELVFEGRVINLNSHKSPDNGMIHTYVTFEILDVIKGIFQEDVIILRFLGGTVGDRTFKISEMQKPELGEKGIYFVESMERMQVHPLYGWSQGHFLIIPDSNGINRVKTNNNKAITAVEPVTQQIKNRSLKLSTGIAKGLILKEQNDNSNGMSVDEFKQHLLNMRR